MSVVLHLPMVGRCEGHRPGPNHLQLGGDVSQSQRTCPARNIDAYDENRSVRTYLGRFPSRFGTRSFSKGDNQLESYVKEQHMTWMTASRVRGALTATAFGAAIAGAAVMGAIATSEPTLQADPGCDAFGWRHPLCAGGAWDQSASSEWGPDASTRAGLDAVQQPSMVPNIDGSMSLPGTPGAI
jgi:hypothetical protein